MSGVIKVEFADPCSQRLVALAPIFGLTQKRHLLARRLVASSQVFWLS